MYLARRTRQSLLTSVPSSAIIRDLVVLAFILALLYPCRAIKEQGSSLQQPRPHGASARRLLEDSLATLIERYLPGRDMAEVTKVTMKRAAEWAAFKGAKGDEARMEAAKWEVASTEGDGDIQHHHHLTEGDSNGWEAQPSLSDVTTAALPKPAPTEKTAVTAAISSPALKPDPIPVPKPEAVSSPLTAAKTIPTVSLPSSSGAASAKDGGNAAMNATGVAKDQVVAQREKTVENDNRRAAVSSTTAVPKIAGTTTTSDSTAAAAAAAARSTVAGSTAAVGSTVAGSTAAAGSSAAAAAAEAAAVASQAGPGPGEGGGPGAGQRRRRRRPGQGGVAGEDGGDAETIGGSVKDGLPRGQRRRRRDNTTSGPEALPLVEGARSSAAASDHVAARGSDADASVLKEVPSDLVGDVEESIRASDVM